MFKKILALVLALLMLTAVFVGCNRKKTNIGGTSTSGTTAATTKDDDSEEPSDDSEETEESTERETINIDETNADMTKDGEVNDTAPADEWDIKYILNPDNWEGPDISDDVDYEGYEFTVLADSNTGNKISQCEFLVESDGELIKEKVAERRKYVEEYLGISFNIIEYEGGYGNMEGFASEIEAASGAGTPYDLSVSYCLIPPIVAAKGLSRDLAESENLNLYETKKPYWGSGIKEEIMIGGRIFWMSDNSSWTSVRSMTCIFVNVDTFERVNQGYTKAHLYEMVDKKTWTMENLIILSQNAYSNTNTGDEKTEGVDNGDEFGLATAVGMARVDLWLYGAGLRYTELNNKGTYDWTLEKPVHVEFIDWWQEKIQNDDDVLSKNPENVLVEEGRAMFMHAPVLVTESNLEYNFTVLPMPFYKTDVKNNYSTSLCNMYGSWLIPKATKTEAFERSATVLEVLAAGGNMYLAPAYFEVYLKRQVATADLDMMRMFNVIRNSIVFDLGYLYGSSLTVENLAGNGIYDEPFLALRRLWTGGSSNYSNITTVWAQIKGTATTKLNNLMVDILDY